jgi:hypothetical protein
MREIALKIFISGCKKLLSVFLKFYLSVKLDK